MEDKDLSDYLAAFRRYRKAFALIFGSLLAVSLLAAWMWPAEFRSTATILIEEQEIPTDLVRSTITSYAAQRLQTINQRVMTRSNLLGIIEKYDLYTKERKKKTSDEILERMRSDIDFQTISAEVIDPRSGHPTLATIAFSLSFDGTNPALVQKVTNEITNLYLEENLKNRTQKTQEASAFLKGEVEQIAAVAAELEKRLSAFKATHISALPEQKPLIQGQLERAEGELKQIDFGIRSLQERNFLIDSQLAQISPENPTPVTGEHAATPEERLKALRIAEVSLVSKYSSKHPDVVKMRQEIEALQRKTGEVDPSDEQAEQLDALQTERAALSRKYAANHPDVMALDRRIDRLQRELSNHPRRAKVRPKSQQRLAETEAENPAYLNLLAQKEANTLEIAGMTERQKELRAKLAEYDAKLQQTPEVERQYFAMTREWENAALRHRDLKAKLMEAQIGEQLERKSKGERFSVVEPPQLPEKPIKPNRPVIAILGLALALAAALGYVFLRETLDTSVRKVGHLLALTGVPPLAVIPHVDPNVGTPDWNRSRWLRFGALMLLVATVLGLAHGLWIPLDVLWFRALRMIDAFVG